jgi:hypothetical protein
MRNLLYSVVALASLSTICSAETIATHTFGTGANAFSIDFVQVGNSGNVPGSLGYEAGGPGENHGAVGYNFSMGKYEITADQISRANSAGNLGITFFGAGDKPATSISVREAVQFVNWMNTSSGYAAAYDESILSYRGPNFFSSATGSLGSPYRNSGALYFLPTLDEWFKSGWYDPNKNGGTGGYWNYAYGSNGNPSFSNQFVTDTSQPTSVNIKGRDILSAYDNSALSPYGTMGQMGNASELLEFRFVNDAGEMRSLAEGADYEQSDEFIDAGSIYPERVPGSPVDYAGQRTGFRIMAVPEPSLLSLLALGGVVVALRRRR